MLNRHLKPVWYIAIMLGEKLFNHILVPVYFNRDTDVVMEKAIGIANEFQCDLHLLYNYSPPWSFQLPNHSNAENEKKMTQLLHKYRHLLHDGLLMDSKLTKGSWFFAIKQFVISHHIDLVIMLGSTRHFLGRWARIVNINRLTKQTNCPVLTITVNMDLGHLKNIVVPISDFLPMRKLTTATYIARQCDANIHLMGYKIDSEENGNIKLLGRAYQLLKDYTQLTIYPSPAYGDSVGGNALSYARQVGAGLIVINPGKESIAGGWFNHLFKRYLYKESDIPVLTIARRP